MACGLQSSPSGFGKLRLGPSGASLGTRFRKLPQGSGGTYGGIVTSVAFSANGTLLASTSGDQTIRIWDVATGICQQVLQGHHACVWSAVFHPDGKTLFSAGEDHVIRVWDLENAACVALWTGHQHWIRAISFDQSIKLWEVETGDCLDTLTGHHKTVASVAFSAEGHFLASGSYDQTIKLWDVEAGYCQKATGYSTL